MQYIYLIQCQKFFKIGIANDVQTRLAQLSTGNPFPLTVISSYGFQNAEVVEKALHQKFEGRWERGEWFSLIPPEIDDFNQICKMLGGFPADTGVRITDEEMDEAEEFQQTFSKDISWRLERRFSDRMNPGWAIMRKGASKKEYLGYIDSKNLVDVNNPTVEEIERFLRSNEVTNE